MIEPEKLNILLVDDQPAKLLSYELILKDLGENLVRANSATEAFEFLLRNDVAVLLVDAFMPDMDGFQLARMVRDHPRFKSTAIIFISAVMMTDVDFLKGYQAGAVDYVSVPVIPEILRAKVKVFSELYRKTRQLELLNKTLEERVLERTRELEARNAEIRRNEERMRLAFEAAELGWWEIDSTGRRISFSPSMAEAMGISPANPSADLEALRLRIHPGDRATFAAFLERVSDDKTESCELRFEGRGGAYKWELLLGRRVADSTSGGTRVSGVNLDISARKAADEIQTLLVHELDHRAKNLLAVVQSIVHLSRADTIPEFVTTVSGRLRSLGVAHSLLSESRWASVDLKRIVLEEFEPFLNVESPRVNLTGESIMLPPQMAQGAALVLHEMITNSVKYGALSIAAGKVDVDWTSDGAELALRWTERDGPPVTRPAREGFGTKLVMATAGRQLGGSACFDWRVEGLRCDLRFPYDPASHANPTPAMEPAEAPGRAEREPLTRVLLVEDEAIVALMMREELVGRGCKVVGPIGTITAAVVAAREEQIDCAILDLNLAQASTYPVAEALRSRAIPFAFLTGYSRDGIDPRFADVPVLEKPVDAYAMACQVESLLKSRTDRRSSRH